VLSTEGWAGRTDNGGRDTIQDNENTERKERERAFFSPSNDFSHFFSEERILKLLPELGQFKKVAYWLAHRFWSEGIAGNMSLRLDTIPARLGEYDFEPIHRQDLRKSYPNLAGRFLAITGTGRRMRDLGFNLKENVGIIRIVEEGGAFETLWGAKFPSSELPAHLGIHNMLVAEREELRAVVHTHPTRLVSLTHSRAFRSSEDFNTQLYRLHPEVGILMPEGINYLDFDVPGSYSLGDHTAEALQERRLVVWANHGVVSVGETLGRAFDWIEVMEKAAEIYWTVQAMGENPRGIP